VAKLLYNVPKIGNHLPGRVKQIRVQKATDYPIGVPIEVDLESAGRHNEPGEKNNLVQNK
jgi:hypothetical protein